MSTGVMDSSPQGRAVAAACYPKPLVTQSIESTKLVNNCLRLSNKFGGLERAPYNFSHVGKVNKHVVSARVVSVPLLSSDSGEGMANLQESSFAFTSHLS